MYNLLHWRHIFSGHSKRAQGQSKRKTFLSFIINLVNKTINKINMVKYGKKYHIFMCNFEMVQVLLPKRNQPNPF